MKGELAFLSRNRLIDQFCEGDKVRHSVFGEGVITAARYAEGVQWTVCVNFETGI